MKSHFALLFLMAAATTANISRAGDLIAHEWGTFTSVQGSDGTVLAWNPLTSSELPKFVHNRVQPFSGSESRTVSIDDLKAVHLWTQRLETPVVYFYTHAAQKVSLEAHFPSGIITEWYPQLTAFGPSSGITNLVKPTKESFARWDDLELLPKGPNDTKLKLPSEARANHYYAARETDSVNLQAVSPLSPGTAPELEKFVFYRGAGNFQAPLHVSLASDESVDLRNEGDQPLNGLFILNIKDHAAKFTAVAEVLPHSAQTVPFTIDSELKPIDETMTSLRQCMEASLVEAGLYRDEAKAMVKTWSDSWFAENGVRVLYLLPREWTDRTIPLSITPSPEQLVRVMVGRADILSHAIETRLQEIYTTSQNPESIPAALEMLAGLHLGRFTQAALTRLEQLEHVRASDHIRELRNGANARTVARN